MDLISIRLNRGFKNIADAAEKAGITQASLSRIERGLQIPSANTASRLAKIYKLKPQEIWHLAYEAGLKNGAVNDCKN